MENSEQENSQSNAPKLKAFQAIQKHFAVAGISPKLAAQLYPFNGRIFMGFLTMSLCFVFICVYIFNYAGTLFEYTQCAYFTSLSVLIVFALAILIFKLEKLFALISDIDSVLNISLKYSATESDFSETNRFEEEMSQILIFAIIKLTPIYVFVPWCMYNYFVYFTSDLGNAAFELPTPMWFPFDWRSPFGFLVAIAIQYVMVTYFLVIAAPILIMVIASYLYCIAVSKIVKRGLLHINRNAQAKEIDQSTLLEQIIESLKMYSCMKQWITNFSDIFQYFGTINFTWSLVTICGALLIIQMQLTQHSHNFAELVVTMVQIFYALSVFMCCELGQRMNLAYAECNEIIDQFDWYLFPAEIQRMLPMIYHFTQQPFEIVCFGSKACDRETLKSVIKTAFSYFMVLRTFYH